jgi:hypothetical protein
MSGQAEHDLEVEWNQSEKFAEHFGLRASIWDAPDALNDVFDQSSDLGSIRCANVPVGCIRLVRPSSVRTFVEQIFSLTEPSVPLENLGEVGRLGILPEYRGGTRGKAIRHCLYRSVTARAQAHRLTHLYVVASTASAAIYRMDGIPLTAIAEYTVRERQTDFQRAILNEGGKPFWMEVTKLQAWADERQRAGDTHPPTL